MDPELEKQLLEHGLQRVEVAPPPDVLREAAEKLGEEMHLRVGGFTCGANSYVLALAAARIDPAAEVRIVGGVAFGEGSREIPAAHVWVRVGDEHFDITWSRYDLPLAQCVYFKAFETDVRDDVLRDVELFALEKGIETQ